MTAANVQVEWRGEDWQRAALPALNAGLTVAAAVAANEAVANLSRNSPPSQPGDFPAHDQSHLRNSIAFASPESLGSPLHAAFGTAVHYGRTLEFGAVITPKKSKLLKVPLDRQLARQAERNNWKLTMVRPEGKNPLLGISQKGVFRPIYVLVPKVVLKPRPWIVRSAEMARARMERAFVRTAKAHLKAAALTKGGA